MFCSLASSGRIKTPNSLSSQVILMMAIAVTSAIMVVMVMTLSRMMMHDAVEDDVEDDNHPFDGVLHLNDGSK